MKTIKINFRIPLTLKDIKELWKEKTDRNFRYRREQYWKLKNAVIKESGRWGQCDKEYIVSHFEQWITPYFEEFAQNVLIGDIKDT